MDLSIIMPVLNESKILEHTLSTLSLDNQTELIVVDGGSSDNTVEIAGRYTDLVTVCGKGRGRQLCHGANMARGDILFFIHADATPPPNYRDIIHDTLTKESVSAGAFSLAIDASGTAYRAIEAAVSVRTGITGITYGDQGLFMKSEVYEAAGGYLDIPLMEDIDICRRLKRLGRISVAREGMKVSPRRWEEEGIAYTTLRDIGISLLYTVFSVNPKRLLGYYDEVR